MKTLTELNGTLIRKAAAAIDQAKKSLPKEAPPAPPAAEAPAEAAAEAAAPAEGAEAAPAEAAAPAPAAGPSEAVKAALEAAVAEATGLSGDRLARLIDAVEVVGGRVDDVRLVRVFGAEEPVNGAKAHNGFQFIVDMAPASMRQDWSVKKEKRFGGKGGGKPGGGGGKGAPTSGGFSMDSLKDDRKGSRGPGGGGRGRPGGGSPR